MANSKISALTSLAQASVVPASDVLPIVNASTTKKVTVDALINAQLAQSATTTGIGVTSPVLRFAVERDSGSGYVASFRSASGNPYITIQTTGGITQIQGINAGFTDVADFGLQPSGGNVKLGNGNLVIGTSGKGIDFSATAGTGTSELFADYEEGTWTPVDGSGAGLVLTVASASYTKVGRLVEASFAITFPATASAATLRLGGLPFTSKTFGASMNTVSFSVVQYGTPITGVVDSNATTFIPLTYGAGTLTNANMSGLILRGTAIYEV